MTCSLRPIQIPGLATVHLGPGWGHGASRGLCLGGPTNLCQRWIRRGLIFSYEQELPQKLRRAPWLAAVAWLDAVLYTAFVCYGEKSLHALAPYPGAASHGMESLLTPDMPFLALCSPVPAIANLFSVATDSRYPLCQSLSSCWARMLRNIGEGCC